MDKEKSIIRVSHVLIPFSIFGKFHAFFGPFPILDAKPDKLKKIFPCLCRCKPHAFEDTTYELGFMSSPLRAFHFTPIINNEAYIN